MSEKHLTEPPWKVLVTKQGVKDIGLGKALVAYGNLDATKEPAKALDGLKEIAELAVKLKKANSAKGEVVDHLDEVLKEVKKTTPGLEARVKSLATATEELPVASTKPAEAAPAPAKAAAAVKPAEEDPGEELEAADFRQDLKHKMISALAQVKARAPGEPEQQKEPKPQLQFMAYLAGTNCAVVVTRAAGSATKKLLTEIAAGASGGKFVHGECVFEKNTHTFVLQEVPTGLAKRLAAALHTETGQKYKVRVRNTDGSVDLDSDTDVDADGDKAQAPPPVAPVANAEETAKFTARFKALQPDMLKAIATKTPQSDEVRRHAAEAGKLANQKDFPQAHGALDALEALLKQVLATVVPPAASPPKTSAAPPAAAASEPAAPRKPIKLSTYLSGRGNLRAARENAAKELQRLQQVILTKAKDEPFYQEIEAKSQRLFDYLAPIDDSVVNKLDEAGRCVDQEKQDELNQKVRELIQKQLASLRGHPLASFVQNNPFGKFIIKQPLEVTLSALDKQLS